MALHAVIDRSMKGREFLGIGAVTSNGMTKLLHEYPKSQQEDILAFLFEPKFGAALQTVKVEIGSDANGTCGTEPSHMRSETDYDIGRGVGLWLAREAKRRNEHILLDAIRWGTPSWITDHEKKYQYYLGFLKGAKTEFGLDFDYLAPDENEGPYSIDWVVNVLRRGLDRDGFSRVKLSGADSTEDWNIAPLLEGNPDLRQSIDAVTRHYKQDSPAFLHDCGLPLFNSEDLAPFRHSFSFALEMAYKIIRSFVSGRMVQYVMHPIIEAIYDSVPYTCKSILLASSPWTGHYEVLPGLWVVAQFTQFIQIGWRFIENACYSSPLVSYVVLEDPQTGGVSIIILNKGDDDQRISFSMDAMIETRFHRWETCEKEQFIQKDDIKVEHGVLQVQIGPKTLCSLTTTDGQQKGVPRHPVPSETRFALPYLDDFDSYPIGRQPKYTIDQGGAFEICEGGFDGSRCLKQVLTCSLKPNDWERRPTPLPYTILGGQELSNYRVQVDFAMEAMPQPDYEGYVLLGSRCNYATKTGDIPQCYNIRIFPGGRWLLARGTDVLAAGTLASFTPSSWHRLALGCEHNVISAFFDDRLLASVVDEAIPSGNVVLGSGYNLVKYDNLAIEKIGSLCEQCRRYLVTDKAVVLTGNWTAVGNSCDNYQRTVRRAYEAGSRMDFRFTGTSVSIVGVLDGESGMADVHIDGRKVAVIDAFSDARQYRRCLFALHDLQPGLHTVSLIVSGLHQQDSSGNGITINALEVDGMLIMDQTR